MPDLKVGDEVSGTIRGIPWKGTVIKKARRVRDHQMMALAKLEEPITFPGFETQELILPLDYVNPEEIPTEACRVCGYWLCESCYNFRRANARRDQHQVCGKCGEDKGLFRPIVHRYRNYHG